MVGFCLTGGLTFEKKLVRGGCGLDGRRGGGGAFACSGEIGSADVRIMFCTCGETDSLRLQGEGEDFLFVRGWEGGGEILISALSSGCRRLLPESSQMSMKSPIGLGSLFGLDDEEAWVFGGLLC